MAQFSAKKRIVRMVIIDVVAFTAAILIFAFFHHVYQAKFSVAEVTPLAQPVQTEKPAVVAEETPAPVAEVSTSPEEAANPDVTPEPVSDENQSDDAPEPTAEPVSIPTGLLGGKYADKFSSGSVISTATEYRSANVAVELSEVKAYESIIHVLDIYIQDLSSFRTYVPRNEGSKEKELMPVEADAALGGVIAITSGDQFYAHKVMGYIVRNGNLYSSKKDKSSDVCVMYTDGTMATFTGSEFNPDTEVAKGVTQVWSFGPGLVKNGTAISSFSTSVNGKNPRLAIGYYEPGHYCLVEVDAKRNSDNATSKGLTLAELAEYMQSLGCTMAYNLDGGGTAGMYFNGQKVNKPGRRATDLIYICEPTV